MWLKQNFHGFANTPKMYGGLKYVKDKIFTVYCRNFEIVSLIYTVHVPVALEARAATM